MSRKSQVGDVAAIKVRNTNCVRREALRRLGFVAVAAGLAGSLLVGCGTPVPDAPSNDAPVLSEPPPGRAAATPLGHEITFAGPSGTLRGSWAAPAGTPRGAILVVHNNLGLTPHFVDLVGRYAGAGYATLCVDLTSGASTGGARTVGVANTTEPAAAIRAAKTLAAAPREALVAEMRAGITELTRRAPGVKVGAVGFGLGGSLLWHLLDAGEPRLAAAVPFYGPAPDGLDFSRSHAAVLGLYPDNDPKLNESQDSTDVAMMQANLVHNSTVYQETTVGFFDDTSPRYQGAGAAKAWRDSLDWFGKYL
ncbi:MAG TPA: dienelactone hydrolase family protein [Pseudonocardia sp.]|jgi:carboxymethylenebutenolidase